METTEWFSARALSLYSVRWIDYYYYLEWFISLRRIIISSSTGRAVLSLIRVMDELNLTDHACLQQFRWICAKLWRSFSFNTLRVGAACEILGHFNRRIRKSASWFLDATGCDLSWHKVPCSWQCNSDVALRPSDFLPHLASKKVILNLSPVSERCFRHSGRK